MSWDYALAGGRVDDDGVGAVLDCLRSGWLTLGPRTQEFERAFADRLGAGAAVAVASGAAALQLACRALSLAPGDEVIVPANARPAVALAVRACGATPVAAAVESERRPLLDPTAVARRISAHTRSVVVWHPWGWAADAAALRALCDERGIALIEDARDALGAQVPEGSRAGTVGHLGCFSCRAGRQLAVGEGGVVATADPALEARVRLLRSHAMTSGTWDRHRGHADAYDVVDLGFNHRMDEPRAALGLARLRGLDAAVAARRELAARYRERLAGWDACFDAAADEAASPLCFPLLVRDRSALASRLAARGIETALPPNAPHAVLLPLWPELTNAGVDAIADAVLAAGERRH